MYEDRKQSKKQKKHITQPRRMYLKGWNCSKFY